MECLRSEQQAASSAQGLQEEFRRMTLFVTYCQALREQGTLNPLSRPRRRSSGGFNGQRRRYRGRALDMFPS